ncbi:hypothetical protein DdX_13885 [Ditylenchus destructor]|uniref:PUB domain-containing protein n=1 Tax=Ditylenchus destructor TaxID=166010 RepID=A0AAD4MXR3_9BILA|nr:hypothetical protein DdX_13885 [Ditylenchus destructor]
MIFLCFLVSVLLADDVSAMFTRQITNAAKTSTSKVAAFVAASGSPLRRTGTGGSIANAPAASKKTAFMTSSLQQADDDPITLVPPELQRWIKVVFDSMSRADKAKRGADEVVMEKLFGKTLDELKTEKCPKISASIAVQALNLSNSSVFAKLRALGYADKSILRGGGALCTLDSLWTAAEQSEKEMHQDFAKIREIAQAIEKAGVEEVTKEQIEALLAAFIDFDNAHPDSRYKPIAANYKKICEMKLAEDEKKRDKELQSKV